MTADEMPVVFGPDRLRSRLEGRLTDTNTSHDMVAISLEDGRRIQLPFALLQAQEDGSYLLPVSLSEIEQAQYFQNVPTDATIIPVIVEEVRIQKQRVETGRVRIQKTVQEHQEVIDEPLLRNTVSVERVAINRLWDGPPPGIRQEGEILIVPVVEEVLVTEKRLMLKEELHIRREEETFHAPQEITLRREEVHIERVSSAPDRV